MSAFNPLRTSEWIVCGFFAYLVVMARVSPLAGARRLRVLIVGLVCAALVVVLSQVRPSPILRLLRDWLPAAYLLQGYWASGLFYRRPRTELEHWLLTTDDRLFRACGFENFWARAPRVVLEYLELAYLMAYPLVPGGFLILYSQSSADPARLADHYWTIVLLSGYGCYGVLPWIQTRPPRTVAPDHQLSDRPLMARRLNHFVLDHGSIQANTFPSGHAASAAAAALIVASLANPLIGAPFALLAASVTVATVLGRYHYGVDTVLGLLVGWAAWWLGPGL
jgi:membrane-associated phospholipid phosphatase